MSPTARTLRHLRGLGYTVAVVEHWNSFAGIRQDLFGWIDVVAVRPSDPGVLGIQCTTSDHAAARVAKARGNEALKSWVAAGNRLVVHGWARRCKRIADGKRSRRIRWELREVPVTTGGDR